MPGFRTCFSSESGMKVPEMREISQIKINKTTIAVYAFVVKGYCLVQYFDYILFR